MNLFELLKQFKHIEPDAAFSASSKRAILAQAELKETLTSRRIIFNIFEAGAAVALTGFFILVLTGALSNSRFAPVQFSAIDPQGIRAEAQAIDIQIELANVAYQGAASGESTVSAAEPQTTGDLPVPSAPKTAASLAAPTDTATATSSSTSTVSIDQALQSLSE